MENSKKYVIVLTDIFTQIGESNYAHDVLGVFKNYEDAEEYLNKRKFGFLGYERQDTIFAESRETIYYRSLMWTGWFELREVEML